MMRKRRQDVPTIELVVATEEGEDFALDNARSTNTITTSLQSSELERMADDHEQAALGNHDCSNQGFNDKRKALKFMALLGGIVFVLFIVAMHVWILLTPSLPYNQKHHHKQHPPRLDYACPSHVTKSANDIPSENAEYERVTNQVRTNLTAYLQTFRNSSFDAWARPYSVVKEGMYHWKESRFAPNLDNGDSIYESACGIGLNLYMTLEILHEVKGIESLVVYGNEYLSASAHVANAILGDSSKTAPFQATKGVICAADSAHIDFVPSNSFDLVYTGYITPINDPLHLNKGRMNDNLKYYKEACAGKDWQSQKLSELSQNAQEDFYGKWISEMVRIAKPGKPVIVEQVSFPYCQERLDWGGVGQEWWEPAISKYGWDIDPSSIDMEKDTIFRNRYHVFMRKNR